MISLLEFFCGSMDAGDDIIDVLYRGRDTSNSPRLHQRLSRSKTSQPQEENVRHGDLETKTSAPQPPRNYERDLYHLTRRSLAYRGNSRLSDNSVFHNKQNFTPSSQQSFYDHTRKRSYSGHHENPAVAHTRRRKHQDSSAYRPHKSEDTLDVDLEKSRSIKIDVVPKEDIISKDIVDTDLVLMPNGTRQRRSREEKGSNLNVSKGKTTLHRTDNQAAETCFSVHAPSERIKAEEDDDEIYSTLRK